MDKVAMWLILGSLMMSCGKSGDKGREVIREETVVRSPYDYYGQQPNFHGPNFEYNNCQGGYCPPQHLDPGFRPQPIDRCSPFGSGFMNLPSQHNYWGLYGYTFQQMGCVGYNNQYYSGWDFYQMMLAQYQNACFSSCYDPYAFYQWASQHYAGLYFPWNNRWHNLWHIYAPFYSNWGQGNLNNRGWGVNFFNNGDGGWGFSLNYLNSRNHW